MKRHLKSTFIFTFLTAISCTSLHEVKTYTLTYRQNISAGRCEIAQELIPLEKDDSNFFRFYQSSLGYIVSVSTLPVTVGMDVLLAGRCRMGCPSEDGKPLMEVLFPTSSYQYEYTKDLRCPDTSYYVQKFLEVAECYENRNDKASLGASYAQLNYLNQEYENGPTCIKIRDSQVIKDSLKRVEEKLKKAREQTFSRTQS